MWSRSSCAALRSVRPPRQRSTHFLRRYNGSPQGPPKTYFQAPPSEPRPPRRILSTLILATLFGGTLFGFGVYTGAVGMIGTVKHSLLADSGGAMSLPELLEAKVAAITHQQAVNVPALDYDAASTMLGLRCSYSLTPTAVGHTCQMPSNYPCEDTASSGTMTYFDDIKRDWCEWAIFDGHAGPATSHLLAHLLPQMVGDRLAQAGVLKKRYVPNDLQIKRIIQDAFRYVDEDVMGAVSMDGLRGDLRRAEAVSGLAPMLSGSCALMALFDPVNGVLRVACTGDSRAVLGRWEGGRYVAKAVSVDQTGFNKDEVERLRAEHPGEDVVNEETGRVFGLAVTRAFGDARWKWTEEVTRKAHELFWGPAPRPNGVVKTPPYLTAEPEVTETKVQTGEHPDFLIMASDGLWDLMSNEDAVTCVQAWLDKNHPTAFVEQVKENMKELKEALSWQKDPEAQLTPPKMPDFEPDEDEDTYWDPEEKTLKWRVSPKHFVVEDENAGMHLVKNALGGKRKRLFEALISLQAPLSRNVRDDITVHVVFFGVDAEAAARQQMKEAVETMKQAAQAGRQ